MSESKAFDPDTSKPLTTFSNYFQFEELSSTSLSRVPILNRPPVSDKNVLTKPGREATANQYNNIYAAFFLTKTTCALSCPKKVQRALKYVYNLGTTYFISGLDFGVYIKFPNISSAFSVYPIHSNSWGSNLLRFSDVNVHKN